MSFLQSIFKMFGDLIVVLLEILGVIIAPMFIMGFVWTVVNLVKGKRLPKRTVKITSDKYVKRRSLLKRIYWDLPRQIVNDRFSANPDGFNEFGVHVFAGEQGSGKTMAMCHFIKRLKEKYPACKVATNFNLDCQDGEINSWRDILNNNNDVLGQIIAIDEIQNWFSSNESKNFPPDMLTEVTQQRKQRKMIIGTSQVFTRISKPIREQITLLYKPITVCGCFTIVRVYRPSVDSEGQVDKLRFIRAYCFVHDSELRNCYDTFHKIQRISLVGFQDRDKQLSAGAAKSQSD